MLSSAAAQPPPAGSGGEGLTGLGGFGRSPSGAGLAQPPPTQLQLQQELLGGHSRGPSPAGSLTGTPRTLSGLGGPPPDASLLPVGAPTAGSGGANGGGPGGPGGKGWSSLDGMPRPNWQQLGGNPSDAILGQQQAHHMGASIQRPPSAGSQGAPGGNPMGLTPSHLQQLQQLQQQQQQQQQQRANQGLPNGLSNSTQQQLLQQHLLLQQQQQQQQQQGVDARLAAAVEYRLQRKALVKTCMRVLDDFLRGEPSQ